MDDHKTALIFLGLVAIIALVGLILVANGSITGRSVDDSSSWSASDVSQATSDNQLTGEFKIKKPKISVKSVAKAVAPAKLAKLPKKLAKRVKALPKQLKKITAVVPGLGSAKAKEVPATKESCMADNGEWDNGQCYAKSTSQDCAAQGGVWEDNQCYSKPTAEDCQSQGGVWENNQCFAA